MYKGIEWLKEEIEGEIKNYESLSDKTSWDKGYIMALHECKGLINQLDESETVADVLVDFMRSSERLKKILSMEVEEREAE